jgi:acetyl-CoA acetyltransferase
VQNEVAIVGVGQTAFGKRGEFADIGTLTLACDAIAQACADAGISPRDVDGYSGYADEAIQPAAVASAFGATRLRYAGMVWGGGGGGLMGAVVNGSMAIVTGQADYVVVHRALCMAGAGGRFGQQMVHGALGGRLPPAAAFSASYGLFTPAQVFGMATRRHMHLYGTTIDHFGEIAINARLMAANNPNARFREPITMDDHHSSRLIADPMRLLDCCMESDGSAAIVLTSAARARDLRQPAVSIRAAVMGSPYRYGSQSAPDLDYTSSGQRLVGEELFRKADVSPDDIDVAMIYDHFTSMVLMALEDYGFCPKGESGPFVADGNIRLGGRLPMNTHGGHLAEAYIHGMTHIIEAVRQLRGTAINQVADAKLVALCGAGGVSPTSGCILEQAA